MKKTVVLLVSAIMLGASVSAVAHPNQQHDDQRNHPSSQHQHPQKQLNDKRADHVAKKMTLKRGERLDSEFRHKRYVIANYRTHRLAEPPRGYHWVKVHGKYVLVDAKHRIYRVK